MPQTYQIESSLVHKMLMSIISAIIVAIVVVATKLEECIQVKCTGLTDKELGL